MGWAKIHVHKGNYMQAYILRVINWDVNQAGCRSHMGAETEEEVYTWQTRKPHTQSNPLYLTRVTTNIPGGPGRGINAR